MQKIINWISLIVILALIGYIFMSNKTDYNKDLCLEKWWEYCDCLSDPLTCSQLYNNNANILSWEIKAYKWLLKSASEMYESNIEMANKFKINKTIDTIKNFKPNIYKSDFLNNEGN